MKYMPFYKLHDWILDEFGASREACLLSIIYSFEETGRECRLSYTQFAEILKISRPRAIERVQKLIESGYLFVTTNGTKTNTYRVNKQAFNNDFSASAGNGTSENQLVPETELALVPETELALVPEMELPSSGNGTSTSAENGTQIDNRKENIKKNCNRECERDTRARESAALFSVPGFPDIRLTKSEYDFLRKRIDYKPTGKSLEAYFAIIESQKAKGIEYPDHFKKIREMAMQDGARILKRESSSFDLDELMQYANRFPDDSSSIDMQEVDSIMNPLGGSSSAADTA